MNDFLLLSAPLYFVLTVFPFHYHMFCFFLFMCSPNFLAMFSVSTKRCLIPVSFFPISTMSSAYATTFSCSLPIFMPVGTIFILCIAACNAKLNDIVDRESPCFNPVLFLKKDDSVPSILTALLVLCTSSTRIY